MKKNRIRKLVLIVFCLVTVALSTCRVFGAVYRKTTANVNLRSKAGSTAASTIVATIPKGKTVTVVGKSTKYDDWYYVSYGSKQGFVQSSYLVKLDADDENDDNDDDDDDDDDSTTTTTMKTTVNLNLRSSGKIASDNIITVLAKGTKVTVLGETSNNWVKVRTSSGRTGYVSAGYLTSVSSSTSATYQTTAVALNMRRTRKVTSGNVILVIPADKKVQILNSIGNWYKVRYNGTTGYVKSGYFKNETSTSTVTEKVAANLNFRSSAKISSSNIITVIPKGRTVKVIREVSGNWFYVQYGSRKGYVKGGYFDSDGSGTSSSSSSSSSSSKKTTANLRLRSSKSTSSSSNIMDVIPKGAKVKIRATYTSGWAKVTYNGQTGYVVRSYLS